MENELYQVHKTKRIYQTFLSNLIWYFFYKQRSYHVEINEKRITGQTFQRIVTSRNVTQDNVNIKNFWKGSRWFCRQCLRTFCYVLRPK